MRHGNVTDIEMIVPALTVPQETKQVTYIYIHIYILFHIAHLVENQLSLVQFVIQTQKYFSDCRRTKQYFFYPNKNYEIYLIENNLFH